MSDDSVFLSADPNTPQEYVEPIIRLADPDEQVVWPDDEWTDDEDDDQEEVIYEQTRY